MCSSQVKGRLAVVADEIVLLLAAVVQYVADVASFVVVEAAAVVLMLEYSSWQTHEKMLTGSPS